MTEESLLLVTDSVPRPIQQAQQLVEPDFRLMLALQAAQQRFCRERSESTGQSHRVCLARLPDADGLPDVAGRGTELPLPQEPGRGPKMVDRIRTGVSKGEDTSVCLLNHKADGTPFWNQFFVAALRDARTGPS